MNRLDALRAANPLWKFDVSDSVAGTPVVCLRVLDPMGKEVAAMKCRLGDGSLARAVAEACAKLAFWAETKVADLAPAIHFQPDY